MKSRPILFSAPMVRAILNGSKTQTRRIVKFDPSSGYIVAPGGKKRWHRDDHAAIAACPYGTVGDELWVRETWRPWWDVDPPEGTGLYCVVQYKDGAIYKPGTSKITPDIEDENTGHWFAAACDQHPNVAWKPSIHMPRWASRITLTITEVRVQRLNEISEVDAMAEGIENPQQSAKSLGWAVSATSSFRILWESINGKDSWDANLWVWAITFARKEAE
jgi:hypothetical protein